MVGSTMAHVKKNKNLLIMSTFISNNAEFNG